MTPGRLLLIAMLISGCGKSKGGGGGGGDCPAACEHMIELAMADLDKNARAIGDPELAARLKADAASTRASDLKTCVGQCQAGKLDARCALAAKTIDGAMTCTDRSGGAKDLTPVDPPGTRTDDEWPKATLREIADEVGGVKFTVKLPTELQEQEADHSDIQRGWDFPGEPFSQPRFRVALIDAFPKTLDEGLAYYDLDDDETALRKEHTGDRFVLLYAAKTFLVAYVVARAGDKAVECYGTHSGSNLTNRAVIGPWLVEICSTLAVK